MNNDVAILQTIADTLKEDSLASQRVLAENAGISVGLMNAILKRFAERGWIMLTHVTLKKLSYALTPTGIAELTAYSQSFVKRTFAIASKYNETLCNIVAQAKKEGKTKIVLYGNSHIKFLLVYVCQKFQLAFMEESEGSPLVLDAFCVVGEQCNEEAIRRLTKEGCVSLLDLIEG